jgi:glutaredoxin
MAWQVLRIEAVCAKVFLMHEPAMKLRILICALLLSAGASQAGNLYRWVDSNGTVHYSDQPPPPSVKKVEEKKFGANVIEGSSSYELQQAVKNFPVTLYATDCGAACNKARQLLHKHGVPFDEKNPNQQPESAEALKKIAGELMVPVLVVGSSQTLKGFEENAWNSALDAAGYPRTSIPVPEAGKATKQPQANVPTPPSEAPAPTPEPKPY